MRMNEQKFYELMGDIDPEANGKDADDDPNKPPEDPNSGDGQGQGGAQDKYEPNNQVIDGETFYGDTDRDLCTLDGIHPNDLGFYRMALAVEPLLKKLLEKN